MSSTSINSISEFLLQAGTEYRMFDMGRGICSIDEQTFLDIEMNNQPVSNARNGYFWVGCLFWNKQLNDEHYIWFIKLPIDEKLCLVTAARNQFLEIVVTALGQQLEHAQDRNAELPENPFVFQPSQQQMSDFNALSRHALGLLKSDSCDLVKAYVSAPSVQDWTKLSLQEISNFAVLLPEEEALQELVATNIALFSPPFISAFSSSLENINVGSELENAIANVVKQSELATTQAQWLRALHNQSFKCIEETVDALLSSSDITIELLVVIAGRHWQVLNNSNRLITYMDCAAKLDQSFELFKGLYSDLVQLPEVRENMLTLLRDPNKSDVLTAAVGALFSSYQNQ